MDATNLIYIVDDNETDREVISFFLEKIGFSNFEKIIGGHNLLERISRQEPYLIIMDTKMPNMTGLEACQKVREQYSPDIIIVGMSSRKDYEKKWQEAGANGFLYKAEIDYDLSEKTGYFKKTLLNIIESAEKKD